MSNLKISTNGSVAVIFPIIICKIVCLLQTFCVQLVYCKFNMICYLVSSGLLRVSNMCLYQKSTVLSHAPRVESSNLRTSMNIFTMTCFSCWKRKKNIVILFYLSKSHEFSFFCPLWHRKRNNSIKIMD